ncbi:hypothetical protein EP13_05915 [Alteromonas australica]|uniref:Uncharacterized protein n=1 Tax=Alteromonas australica TaxID=589873 RepID=A0A075P4P5_9ALTE|nr:hypothetical protein EP13_05915 [Alteromonas australica]
MRKRTNKTLLALPSVAGTLTRGLTHFVRILAHVLAPQSLKLEGVSLNYYWFSKKTAQLPSPVFFKHRPSIGGFNVAALTSKAAQ